MAEVSVINDKDNGGDDDDDDDDDCCVWSKGDR